MDECKARGVVVVPRVKDEWCLRLKAAFVKQKLVAKTESGNASLTEHHAKGKQPYVFEQWDMVAVELNFSVYT